VRWVERGKGGAVLCGAPLVVAGALREHLWQGGITAVLASATLGPVDDPEFRWLRAHLGLDERVDTLRLGSPFDYRRAVEVVFAEAMPDPGTDPGAFRRDACERTLQHVLDNGGRALVLCTSWDLVHAMAMRLRDPLAWQGIELLVQGEAPLAQLLQRKREEPTSVLVGTDSFWEGIDIRGDALTLVVVTRLPFHSPGHPLTKARLQAIERRGGDPFLEHSLPEAILKFRQGFGRLIRSQEDHGKVVILDPRTRTRSYGRRFLASLPLDDDS
jgi:ATP-dependent DNA helicase DinG